MESSTLRMSADTSPLLRPSALASKLISRLRSRRLIWFGPVDAVTLATCDSRTTRGLPSAAAPNTMGSCCRSAGLSRLPGGKRTMTS